MKNVIKKTIKHLKKDNKECIKENKEHRGLVDSLSAKSKSTVRKKNK